jgi:hypothetical protein
MEMGFVESMRRRWEKLGIMLTEKKGGDEGEGGEGMDMDGEDESEDARRAIMGGAIAKEIISNAAKGPSPLLSP